MPARPPAALRPRRFVVSRDATRATLVVEAMEDRAQPSTTSLDPLLTAPLDPTAIIRTADIPPLPAASPAAEAAPILRHELVLIDADVPDREALVRDLLAARFAGTAVDVVELTGGGMAEVSAVIAGYRGLDAVHIISHGEQGAIHLGSDIIESTTLDRFAGDIRGWGRSLNAGADILLYGCDVAGDASGQALAARIASLAGADVAASADLTGAASLGGDWNLEYRTGRIETASLQASDWAHALAPGPALWVSTAAGNTTVSAANGGISWTMGEAISFGNPNLSLGAGTTSGTFSKIGLNLDNFAADGQANLNGFHYVSRTVTVGGAHAVTLQAGDLLISVASTEVLGGVTVGAADIALFRPTTPGDYRTGTFSVVLENPLGAATRDFALVETTTVVGGVTLNAGDFLLTSNNATYRRNVTRYQVTDAGVGTTAGTISTLIDGQSSGVGFSRDVFGVELVQQATTLGGVTLSPGQFLLSLNGDDPVGTNSLDVKKNDVFVFTVTATGTGTSSGSAAFLTHGANVGLSGSNDVFDALSLGLSNPVTAAAGINVVGDSFLVSADNSVLRINALTGATLATYSTGLANDGATFGPDGTLYVADYYGKRVHHYDAKGTLLASFPTTGTPQGLAFGPDGNLYVTTTDSTVEKYSPTGANLGTFIPSGSGGLSNAKAIVWGPDGNAYVSSYSTSQVLRYNGATGAFIGVFATGSGGFEDITFGPDGNLYAASYGDGKVYRYRGSDGATLGTFVTGVSTAYGLRFDPAGNLAVSIRSTGQIKTYDGTTGAFIRTLATGLNNPAYVTTTNSLVTTSAGETATLRLSLASQPTADVTITLTSGQTGQGTLSQSTLTFTASNWNVSQVVSVTGLDDGTANGDQVYQIAGSVTSTDVNYNGRVLAPVTVTNREVAVPNRPPVATNDPYATNEDTPVTVSAATGVLSNDTDPDNNPLAASLASGPAHGAVQLNSDGSFTYTPAANYFGPDSFTYNASDGHGGTATGTVTITVRAVNDAPSFSLSGNPPATDEDAGAQTVAGFATGMSAGPPNENGQTLSFAVTGDTNPGLFSAGPAVAADGTLTYTAAPDASGTATITLVLRDNGGTANGGQDASTTRTFTITVRAVNDPPTLNTINNVTVAEDSGASTVNLTGISAGGAESQTLQVTTTSNDPMLIPNPSVTYTSPNATGALTFTPSPDANGTATITVTVRDAGLNGFLGDADDAVTSRTFTVTVNPVPDPPTANPDTYSTAGLIQLSVGGAGVLGNDTDPDGDPVTSASLVSTTSNGLLVFAGDGSFTYLPNLGFSGVDTFTYQAVDSTGLSSAPTTVMINVALGNRPPVAVNDSLSTNQDTPFSGDVLSNDSDPDGDTITAAVASPPSNGSLIFNANGTFTYTPNANFNGGDSFTYTVNDGKGGIATATVNISIVAVNDPPTAMSDPATVAEDGSVTINVRANDTDAENDPLTVVAVTQPPNGTVNTDGVTVTYTPDADFSGVDTFTYTVSDGNGGTATATVTVTVTAVNDPPTLDPISDVTVAEDSGASTVNLTGVSAGGGESQTLTVTTTSSDPTLFPNPAITYASPKATGTLTFTPNPNANGTATITVTVDDGTTMTSQTFTVTVTAVNDSPVVTPVADQTILEDATVGPLAFTVSDVETPANALTVSATSSNQALIPDANISIMPTGGGGQQITLVPVANNSGATVITITVSDGTAVTTTMFTVTVTPVNDAPVASDDDYTTTRDTQLAVPASGTLVNDNDADGDVLTATLATGPQNGTVRLNPDGSFVYDPNPGFVGTDTFTYQAVDSSGAVSGSATVTVHVLAPEAADPTPTAPAPAPTSQAPPNAPPASPSTNTTPDDTNITAQTQPAPAPGAPPRFAPQPIGSSAVGFADVVSTNSGSSSVSSSTTSATSASETTSHVAFFIGGSGSTPEAAPAADGKGLQGDLAASGLKPPPPESPAPNPPRTQPEPPISSAIPPVPATSPAAETPVPSPSPDPTAVVEAVAPALDKVSSDLDADAGNRALTDAVVTTAATATAGYVLLNTRAVSWLISALLARPAVWRRFDPIDVIYSWEQEQELGKAKKAVDEEDESLQSMVS